MVAGQEWRWRRWRSGRPPDARNQGAVVESFLKKFIKRSEYLGRPLPEGCRWSALMLAHV
jgi:hypothetical protein